MLNFQFPTALRGWHAICRFTVDVTGNTVYCWFYEQFSSICPSIHRYNCYSKFLHCLQLLRHCPRQAVKKRFMGMGVLLSKFRDDVCIHRGVAHRDRAKTCTNKASQRYYVHSSWSSSFTKNSYTLLTHKRWDTGVTLPTLISFHLIVASLEISSRIFKSADFESHRKFNEFKKNHRKSNKGNYSKACSYRLLTGPAFSAISSVVSSVSWL